MGLIIGCEKEPIDPPKYIIEACAGVGFIEETQNISRSTIYQYLKKVGIKINGFKKLIHIYRMHHVYYVYLH